MPRYFFDVDDGNSVTRDDIGLELDGPDVAEREALRTLGDIARDILVEHGSGLTLRLGIRTEERPTVFLATLTLTLTFGEIPGP